MFSIDDRAGNVITTVALFLAAAAILYLARGAFLILLLSLLFAYLLEPAVTLVQRHSRLGRKNRTWAIAQVYLVGTLVLGSVGYKFGPHVAAQIKNLNAAVPEILQGLSSGKTPADLGARHGLSAAQQQRIHDWLARNHDFIARVFERGAQSAAYIAASVIWLFAIPILADLHLARRTADGGCVYRSRCIDGGIEPGLKRILRQVDAMLGQVHSRPVRPVGLSFGFYSVSMLVLRFPYAIALGLLGGVLEFSQRWDGLLRLWLFWRSAS